MFSSYAFLRKVRSPLVIAALAVAVPATANAATVLSISSNATALTGSLSALNLVTIGLGPISSASGSTAPSGQGYSKTDNFAGVTVASGLGGLFGQTTTADIISTTASASFPTNPSGYANASITDLNLGALVSPTLAVLLSSLSLNASAITSTTTFDGTQLTGTSTLANLGLASGLASASTIAGVGANPAANTTLVSLAGIKVLLNEQIKGDTTANGINTKSLTTNAVHLIFDGFGANLLRGDLVLGQSQVSVQSAVPEPASWAMMIVGFGAMGTMLRASRRRPGTMPAF